MLRGAQKQMIVIRTHNSRLFEEAYFVVRKPRTGRVACKEDMLWEANRIIERSLAAAPETAPAPTADPPHAPAMTSSAHNRPARRWTMRGVWFGLGALCGGGIVQLLHILL